MSRHRAALATYVLGIPLIALSLVAAIGFSLPRNADACWACGPPRERVSFAGMLKEREVSDRDARGRRYMAAPDFELIRHGQPNLMLRVGPRRAAEAQRIRSLIGEYVSIDGSREMGAQVIDVYTVSATEAQTFELLGTFERVEVQADGEADGEADVEPRYRVVFNDESGERQLHVTNADELELDFEGDAKRVQIVAHYALHESQLALRIADVSEPTEDEEEENNQQQNRVDPPRPVGPCC